RGCALPRLEARHFALVALYFGGAQALMPLLGALAGEQAMAYVRPVDHWIAFGILSALGARMIYEGLRGGDALDPAQGSAPLDGRLLLPLAVATSVDALAAGFTLPTFGAPLPLALATIGLVTAGLSGLGLYLGHRFGAGLGGRLDLLGGA